MEAEVVQTLQRNRPIAGYVFQRVKAAGLDPWLALSQAFTESRFRPDVVGSLGEQGMFQFMPSTWQQFGAGGNPFDYRDATEAYIRFMSFLMRRTGGNKWEAVRQYAAGPYSRPPAGESYVRYAQQVYNIVRRVWNDGTEEAFTLPKSGSLSDLATIIAIGILIAILLRRPR